MNDASFSKLMIRLPCSGCVAFLGQRTGGVCFMDFPLLECGLLFLFAMLTVEWSLYFMVFDVHPLCALYYNHLLLLLSSKGGLLGALII